VLDAPLRRRLDPYLDAVALRLHGRGVRANGITWLGFLFGLGAVVLVAQGLYLCGLALFLINRLLDGIDGALARIQGISELGGFLDIVLDFLVYAGLAFAFALADPHTNALYAAFLLFAFMGTASSFLAFAAAAARKRIPDPRYRHKSIYYLGGLTEGTETIAFFLLACLWPEAFPVLAVAFGLMCWLTTAGRIRAAVVLLQEPRRRGLP